MGLQKYMIKLYIVFKHVFKIKQNRNPRVIFFPQVQNRQMRANLQNRNLI